MWQPCITGAKLCQKKGPRKRACAHGSRALLCVDDAERWPVDRLNARAEDPLAHLLAKTGSQLSERIAVRTAVHEAKLR